MSAVHASPAARSVSLPLAAESTGPPQVRGKFFWTGDRKFYVCAVSYGPFAVASHGTQFPERGDR